MKVPHPEPDRKLFGIGAPELEIIIAADAESLAGTLASPLDIYLSLVTSSIGINGNA